MTKNADYWIEKLGLSEHPEGGYWAQTYLAGEWVPGECLPDRFGGSRRFATGIYFLLREGQSSVLHRIQSDEQWHFHAGSSLMLYVIEPNGSLLEIKLGSAFDEGESFHAVVPAGCWFGAMVRSPGTYSLVGCTVAPGFDFADFEIGRREDLLRLYPQHKAVIEKLTA